ncbi:Antitermination protein Q [Escherichia coli]|nr:Antitermination protein Q [Escherichia coli]
MNNQYLQFVREQLMIATADLSGSTKGQQACRRMPCLIQGVTGVKKSGTAMK